MEDLPGKLTEIEARLDRLERLAGLAPRTERIAASQPPPRPVGPPPRISAPPRPVYRPVATAHPPQNPSPVMSAALEYQIGAKVGPILGAIAILGGIGYGVSLALQRGLITPAMLFGFFCVLCIGFIGLGALKRDEKEQFGQVLTGIGSCGLYLNFAAGHVYQSLYSGEVLVTLFVVLSSLNLAYAFWRSSRVFLAIGIVGGIAASVMPLDQGKVVLSLCLHFLVLLPALAIAARHRWSAMVAAIYIAATVSLFAALDVASGPASYWAAGAVMATSLAVSVAYLWGDAKVAWDPEAAFPTTALLLSGLIVIAYRQTPTASAVLAVSGLVAAAASVALARNPGRTRLLLGGVLIASLLAPYGLSAALGQWVFLGLSVGLAGLSLRFAPKAGSIIGALCLACSSERYITLLAYGVLGRQTEQLFLVGALVAVVAVGVSIVRAWGDHEPLFLAAMAAFGPFVVRLVYLSLQDPSLGTFPTVALASGLLVYAALLSGLALATSWRSATALGWASLVGTLLLYSMAVYGSAVPTLGSDASMVTVIAGVAAALLIASGRRSGESQRSALISFGVVLMGVLFSRLGYLMLAGVDSLQATQYGATVAGANMFLPMLAWSASAAGISLTRKWQSVATGSAIWWLIPAGIYASVQVNQVDYGRWDVWIVLSLIGTLTLASKAFQSGAENDAAYGFAAALALPLAGRLGYLVAGPTAMGMSSPASVSTGWIALALVLLTLGFMRDRLILRLSSFAVLGITIGKVGFVDLAETDQIVKVVVLIILGLALLGGGYMYIRTKGAATTPDP